MAITVLGADTFQWLTNPAFLIGNRWSSGVINSINSPGPYGSGVYLHAAGGDFLDTYAFNGATMLMVEFSARFSNFQDNELVQLKPDGNNVVGSLGVTAGGQIILVGSAGGTQVLFPANMATNTWYRIQANFKFGAAGTGHFLVRVNGNQIADYTGSFPPVGVPTPITLFRFRMGNFPGMDFTNVIWGLVTDPVNDWFPADQRAICLRALADSSVTWTPNGAAQNFQCIDEANPDSDTTYNSSSNPGDQDLFTVTPPGLTGTINLVVSTTISKKTDAAPKFISPSIRTNATTVQGPSWGAGSNYQGFSGNWQINPVTGLPFTPAEIDAIEFGYLNAS